MGRKTKHASLPPAAPAVAETPFTPVEPGRMESLTIDEISESKTNPRKTFSGLDELAESIRATGLHQPIVVRPNLDPHEPGMRYELVFGARRLRACKLAGCTTIPAIVREMSDAAVREAQLIENNQRADVNLMEEAQAYDQAICMDGYSVAKLAAKIGRSESYVAQRVHLLKLLPEFQEMMLQEKIQLGHARPLARATADTQRRMLDEWEWKNWEREDWTPPSPVQIADDLERDRRELSKAGFSKNDADLVPEAGPCTTCMHRTGFNRALFDDIDPKSDQCNNAECFQAKIDAHVKRKQEELAAKGVVVVTAYDGYCSSSQEKSLKAEGVKVGTLDVLTPKQVKAMSPDDVQTVLVVGGNRAGQVVKVAVPKATGGPDDRYAKERAASARKLKALKAVMASIKGIVLNACRAHPEADRTWQFIARNAWMRATNDTHKSVAKLLGFEKPKDCYEGFDKQAKKHIEGSTVDELRDLLLILSAESFYVGSYSSSLNDDTKKVAEAFDIDWKALLKEEEKRLKEAAKGKGKKGKKSAVDDDDDREDEPATGPADEFDDFGQDDQDE